MIYARGVKDLLCNPRYVKVEGYPGALPREAIRLHGVRVDLEYTGSVMTSNDRINEVSRIGRGAFLGNLAFGFPSDCPTRAPRTHPPLVAPLKRLCFGQARSVAGSTPGTALLPGPC